MAKHVTDEYVPINGISQYFLHIPNDSKDVAIMLHGGPGIPNSYLAYYHQPYLDFCNVVYYDQRGSGKTQLKSKTKPESLSMDILLEDLKQTIQYVKEKYQTHRIFLVGHSCGSTLGTQYIIRYPTDVCGYIGYGQEVAFAPQHRSWYEHLKAAVLKSGNQKDIKKLNTVNTAFPDIPREEFVKETILLTGLESKYGFQVTDYINLYKKSPIMTLRGMIQMIQMNIGGKISRKLLGDVFYGHDVRNITAYQVPIYYILGRHDEWTPSTLAAEYFETIKAPQKGLYWIEDAGHFIDTDKPSAFFGTIKEIMTQQG
ncbi:MAG: alpha/beta hydrolase [Oscillospiraceae bacterium]|nr:alpha/beta hydrolase [Oscillospiraceae bacterium]